MATPSSDPGFQSFPNCVSAYEMESLKNSLTPSNGQIFALRNLLVKNEAIQQLASSAVCLDIARALVGPAALAVKATYFDKTPGANWIVPPHQDVTIAVKNRTECSGFTAWTEKGGIVNVQPPAEVLAQMIALRVHLDDCDEDNGALKVWPGSHLHGRLNDSGIKKWLIDNEPISCPVAAGGIMAMRPLLIHASSKAKTPTNRRVIHIEYAGCDLPEGLEWLSEIR